MSNQRPQYAREGFSRAFRDEGSKYFDKNEKTGSYSDIKDGYISSQTPMQGMGEEVAHIKDDGYGGFYDDDETYSTYVYKKPQEKKAAPKTNSQPAPAPAEKPNDDLVIKQRPERAKAKEKAQAYQGSTFAQKYLSQKQ